MKKLINLILMFFLFVSCAEDEKSSLASSGDKDLFSLWTRNDNTFSFDITGQSFSQTFEIGFLLGSGEFCSCLAFIIGSQSTGSISVNNCLYMGGGAGDPNCAAIWENGSQPYTYTKSGGTLTLCDNPSSCGTYN